jgi:hypothetical protein
VTLGRRPVGEERLWLAALLVGAGSRHPDLMKRATLNWLALDAALDVVDAAKGDRPCVV